jgi:hypothetical protein
MHNGRITGDLLQVIDYAMLSAGVSKVPIFHNVRWGIMGGIRPHLLRSLAQDSFCAPGCIPPEPTCFDDNDGSCAR